MARFIKLTHFNQPNMPLFVNVDHVAFYEPLGSSNATLYFRAATSDRFLSRSVNESVDVVTVAIRSANGTVIEV